MCGRPLSGKVVTMSGVLVNVDNFARAETDRMFAALQAQADGVNRWGHSREPAPVDQQTAIRMNRDTLYSAAVVDISGGARLALPDAGDRYVSLMVLSQDRYVKRVFHGPGEYDLASGQVGTRYALAAARILVTPGDRGGIAAVNALQDRLGVTAGSARPFAMPDYDRASLDATRAALLELARGLGGFQRAFGSEGEDGPRQRARRADLPALIRRTSTRPG